MEGCSRGVEQEHMVMSRGNCYGSDLNPKLSPTFKGLLDNLTDYNITWTINSTGQVTILHKTV